MRLCVWEQCGSVGQTIATPPAPARHISFRSFFYVCVVVLCVCVKCVWWGLPLAAADSSRQQHVVCILQLACWTRRCCEMHARMFERSHDINNVYNTGSPELCNRRQFNFTQININNNNSLDLVIGLLHNWSSFIDNKIMLSNLEKTSAQKIKNSWWCVLSIHFHWESIYFAVNNVCIYENVSYIYIKPILKQLLFKIRNRKIIDFFQYDTKLAWKEVCSIINSKMLL